MQFIYILSSHHFHWQNIRGFIMALKILILYVITLYSRVILPSNHIVYTGACFIMRNKSVKFIEIFCQ